MVTQTCFCAVCREVLVMEPYQHPHRSKERGDVWNQVTVNLSDLDHPKFKVNKRSMRDILTLLITKHEAKIRQEENATGITCKDTELDLALEEIIERRRWSTKNLQGKKKKEKEEGAAGEEHRQSTMDRLGQTVKRHFEHLSLEFSRCPFTVQFVSVVSFVADASGLY